MLESHLGSPSYLRGEDQIEFVLGSGIDLEENATFRAIPLDDQWQLANFSYKGRAPMVVADYRGKGQYRTWAVHPVDSPGRGVILEPLHDDGTFFRGGKAFSTDPLILASGVRSILEYMESEASFNRISVAVSTGKGWGDVSRLMALLHNFGFVRATGANTWYGPDSEAVLSLKSDKDRQHAPGNKMNYERTESWTSLRAQFDHMVAAKLKNLEVMAGSSFVAPDKEARLPDGDLVPGEGPADALPVPVDEGPVRALEVLDH